jgi:transposase InsO family protein
MRLLPEQRRSMVDAVRRGFTKTLVAAVYNVSRKTVTKWSKRAHRHGRPNYKDKKPERSESKITLEVELTIIALRTTFDWGTARIQQGLIALPKYAREVIPHCVQGLNLSRTSINEVLKRYGLNGYKKTYKRWKFFRAKRPNELWQADLKGPYSVQGNRYWFFVCIDDYSRYLRIAEHFDHAPTSRELMNLLEALPRKPEKILTDNGPQFREEWKHWCAEHHIEPLFAHPYYPQDTGKIERAIRNLNEEFIYLLKKFPQWLNGEIKDYKEWYNNKRYHRGINAIPVLLYTE